MNITSGKLKSLEAVSNAEGIISAAAMDQRGSLQKSIASLKGISPKDLPREDMEAFKIEVTQILTQHASAILLDPEFGLPASKKRAAGAGLLLAYEVTGYDNAVAGRMPELLPDVTVKNLKEWDADCVKLLLYYTPFEDAAVNNKKKDFIKAVGDECAKEDIAFFLEPVGYDVNGGDGKDLAYAKIKPEVVEKTTAEFTNDVYGVDVLKVEVPVNMKYCEGGISYCGQKAYAFEEAKALYRSAADASTKPIIYLSAGVTNPEFVENLEMAAASGANFSGVLCGRATWMDGIKIFAEGGAPALAAWLNDVGVKNINQVNAAVAKGAQPWFAKYGGRDQVVAA
ncbi:MAG: tagatose 1,6-diphosphate aldolase [Candidatus Omnitrophota bacterium]|jgi:tagatose 1,6-diphosphate aldolase